VLLTTHDLLDVEKLCNRVMIIDHGELVYDGKLELLRERFGGKRKLIVDFIEEYDQISIEGAIIAEREGSRITFHFTPQDITASELINQLSSRYRIRDLEVREPDIETTIRRIYEERLLE
jgi:ABC-2 type transport system ATP-binding protein